MNSNIKEGTILGLIEATVITIILYLCKLYLYGFAILFTDDIWVPFVISLFVILPLASIIALYEHARQEKINAMLADYKKNSKPTVWQTSHKVI